MKIDDFNAMITLKNHEEFGDKWKRTNADGTGKRNMAFQNNDLLANVNYKGFSFNAFVTDGDYPWETWEVAGRDRFDINVRQYFFDGGYVWDITDTLKANFNATYNRMREGLTNESKDMLYEANLQGQITDNFNFVFGGLIERNKYWVPIGQKGQSTHHSLYLQGDYKPYDWIKLIAGAQMNKPDSVKYDISPRAGAVITFNENWKAKLLYSEAFRSAAPFETHFDIFGFIIGDTGLSPEKISTYEAQLNYEKGGIQASLTAFRSDMDGLIGRRPIGPGGTPPIQYMNQRGHKFEGIEFEGKYVHNANWSFFANASWQDNRSDDEWEAPFPTVMIKGGAMYTYNDLSIGVYNSFFEAPQYDYNSWASDPSFRPNPDPESYNLLTANIAYDMSSLFGKDKKTIVVSVYGDNLLNEDIWYSKYDRYDVNSVPLRNGPGVFGTVAIKF